MRRRKDIFVKANSIADIQELMTVAVGQKDQHEAKERILKRKIEEMTKVISITREEFISFLRNNGIDTSYPVINDVTSDAVVPDTIPEQSISVIPIEEAMLSNLPNDTFLLTMNLVQNKFEPLLDEIEEYIDSLLKMRLHKSYLEAMLDGVKKSTEEYQDKIKENQQGYNDSIQNLEKIKSLYQSLLDFKYLFTILPDVTTADSYLKFQNNSFDRYSSNYYEKKKVINKFSGILQDSYKLTPIDQVEQGFYTMVFRDISLYFGPFEKDNLPDKYVDAMPKKVDILKKLDEFSESLNKLISNVKVTLDTIRGVKGIGNSVVEGLVNSTNDIANSFAAEKRVEHSTFETVSNNNYTVGLAVNREIQSIKDKLQAGVENLDERFKSESSDLLRKIAITIGFPVTFFYDRNLNLEDHLREKVRQKFGGNIPFCDEVETLDVNGKKTFIKKSNIDAKTGKSTKDAQGDLLEKMTRTNRDIMA